MAVGRWMVELKSNYERWIDEIRRRASKDEMGAIVRSGRYKEAESG